MAKKTLRQVVADPFDVEEESINEGGKPMENRKPAHRGGDPRGPQYTIGTDYSKSALIRAEFTYADGHKVAFKHEEMIPNNPAWVDAVKTLPPTVATRRFWVHELYLEDIGHAYFLTDEELLAFANKERKGKTAYTDVKAAAADLRFNLAWLEVDNAGEPVRMSDGQFVIVDLDPAPARKT